MKVTTFLRKYAVAILIIFHLVGLLGITLIDRSLFATLSPLNLLLSLLLIWLSHRPAKYSNGILILFISCLILGYLVELLGTQTGFPFGNYQYGSSLGVQLFEVPVIIGVNWFLLVMGSGYIMKGLVNSRWLRITGGAVLMTLADIAIEPMAPVLDFWYWEEGFAPLMNYAGWFVVSMIMLGMFEVWISRDENRVAVPSFFIVVTFFISLNLLL